MNKGELAPNFVGSASGDDDMYYNVSNTNAFIDYLKQEISDMHYGHHVLMKEMKDTIDSRVPSEE